MSNDEAVGQLKVAGGELNMEWEITEFLSLSADVNKCYHSPIYFFGDTSWRIHVYPNGTTRHSSEGYIGMYLKRVDSGAPMTVTYSAYLKTKNGGKVLCSEEKMTYDEKKSGWGIVKAIRRSELIERESEFMSSGALKVILSLKLDSEEKIKKIAMSNSEVVGQLKETGSVLLIEWELTDFLLLSSDVSKCYNSPVHFLSDTAWCIELYPYGEDDSSKGYIGMYLKRVDSGTPMTVTNSAYLKTEKSDKVLFNEFKYTFDEKHRTWGMSKAMRRSELIEQKSEFMSLGALKVIWLLKFDPEGKIKTITMPGGEVVGQLKRTGSPLEIEWELTDFPLLSSDVSKCYNSPVHVLGDTAWYIRLYPNGRNTNSEGYIGIFLVRADSGPPITVTCSTFLKKKEGRKVLVSPTNKIFEKEPNNGWGHSKILKRSELIKQKSELMPSGALKIICSLKFNEEEIKNALKESPDFVEAATQTDFFNQSSSIKEHFKQEGECSSSGVAIEQSCVTTSQSSGEKQNHEDSLHRSGSNSPVQCLEPPIANQSSISDPSLSAKTYVSQCSSFEKHSEQEEERCSSSGATVEQLSDIPPQSSGERSNDEDSLSQHSTSSQMSAILNSPVQCSVSSRSNLTSYRSMSSRLYGLEKLSQNLEDLYVQSKGYDLIFRVRGKEYRAHRAILRARIPAFDVSFIVGGTVVIPIEDCDPEIFQDFLLYIYTGRVENLSHENVHGLATLARKYGLQHLRNMCTKFLRSSYPIKRNDHILILVA